MALKLNERYPGRFNNPTTSYPQGSFKNRTAPTAQDGSYLEQDWMNDIMGLLGRLITVSGVTLNGNVDTALSSQYYDAMSAIFAKLASPALTGIPTAPTAAAGTNTTQISTTAFVQAAIASLGTAASRNVGTGTNQIPDMSYFGSSLIANGFKNLPGGFILQWGAGNTTVGGATVSFPVAFPNACATITGNESNNGVSPVIVNFNAVNKTSFQVFAWSNTGTGVNSFVRWYAIGY